MWRLDHDCNCHMPQYSIATSYSEWSVFHRYTDAVAISGSKTKGSSKLWRKTSPVYKEVKSSNTETLNALKLHYVHYKWWHKKSNISDWGLTRRWRDLLATPACHRQDTPTSPVCGGRERVNDTVRWGLTRKRVGVVGMVLIKKKPRNMGRGEGGGVSEQLITKEEKGKG